MCNLYPIETTHSSCALICTNEISTLKCTSKMQGDTSRYRNPFPFFFFFFFFFFSIWKFIYQCAEEGASYQTNMPGIFSNSILTMKSKVESRPNMGIKLKNAPITLKYISNSFSHHKE